MVRTGQQFPLNIETERNIASLQDVFAVTYSNLMHVMGTSWTSNYDGPTNEQLRDPANWSLAYCDPRLIPLVDLIVNTEVCLPAYKPLPAADRISTAELRFGALLTGGSFFVPN